MLNFVKNCTEWNVLKSIFFFFDIFFSCSLMGNLLGLKWRTWSCFFPQKSFMLCKIIPEMFYWKIKSIQSMGNETSISYFLPLKSTSCLFALLFKYRSTLSFNFYLLPNKTRDVHLLNFLLLLLNWQSRKKTIYKMKQPTFNLLRI